MASLPAQLIFPLLLLLLGGGHVLMKAEKECDYFTLVLTWSGTECLSVDQCCPTNACCRSDVATGFTIRAFWADYSDGTNHACCKGPKYDENEISSIMEGLNKLWPSYDCTLSSACGSDKGSHWAYQWVKYGTCASPVLVDQYEYFTTPLIVYFKYNINDILLESGYKPSNSAKYPLEGITSAIKNALLVTPVVTCYGDSLKEVKLCFDKTLQSIECPTTSTTESSIESGMLSKSTSECPSLVSLPIKSNATLLVPESKNHLSFHGVQNW